MKGSIIILLLMMTGGMSKKTEEEVKKPSISPAKNQKKDDAQEEGIHVSKFVELLKKAADEAPRNNQQRTCLCVKQVGNTRYVYDPKDVGE